MNFLNTFNRNGSFIFIVIERYKVIKFVELNSNEYRDYNLLIQINKNVYVYIKEPPIKGLFVHYVYYHIFIEVLFILKN